MPKFRSVLLFILFFNSIVVFGQNNNRNYSFVGKILNKETNKPINYAFVAVENGAYWTYTDAKGNFKIEGIKKGEYNYLVSCLGYEDYSSKVKIDKNTSFQKLYISSATLVLDDIVVTAKKSDVGSSSIIDLTAITHIQPKSVEDLLQLVPGNLTQNPSLNSAGQAYIREINNNGNNAMGTAVIVDGTPISNDANLQVFNTSMSGTSERRGSSNQMQTTSGKGVDLRTISPDNIESVEVVRGIASAEYGNLTSGALIIKTKFGETPLEVKAKVDATSKLVYIGKGIKLSDRAGVLNVSSDYSQSYQDVRTKYTGYERITAGLGYSNSFKLNKKPITLNAKFSFHSNINNNKKDPQMLSKEYRINKNIGTRFNVEGNWALNSKLISNIAYNVSVQKSLQKDKYNSQVHTVGGVAPIATSMVDGEFEANFLTSTYYSEYQVEGKPLDIFTQLKFSKFIKLKNDSYNNLKLGFEWNLSKNNGNGLTYDLATPPTSVAGLNARPRSYKDIPALNVATMFLEDKLYFDFNKTNLTIQAGVRASQMFVNNRDNIGIVDPRLNITYNFIQRESLQLGIVGGYGIASKMPSLVYLYPNKAYFDRVSFNSYKTDDAEKSMVVISTKVIDETANKNLKASYSDKVELGLTGNLKGVSASFTFFNENYHNEYGYSSVPSVFQYRKYSNEIGTTPLYRDGKVVLKDDITGETHDAKYVNEKVLFSYNSPQNVYKTKKIGVEYSLDLGKIKPLKTSVIIDGSWIKIDRRRTEKSYNKINTSGGSTLNFPYMSVMPSGKGNVSERINTNFRFVTHIPYLKMVFSTTLQVVWYESYQRFYKDSNNNDLWYSSNSEKGLSVNPIGYIDDDLAYRNWSERDKSDADFSKMVSHYTYDNYFDKEVFPINAILNFRLTKEFGNVLEMSFMANNFLKFNKYYKYKTMGGYKTMCIPLYFGAELKIKL